MFIRLSIAVAISFDALLLLKTKRSEEDIAFRVSVTNIALNINNFSSKDQPCFADMRLQKWQSSQFWTITLRCSVPAFALTTASMYDVFFLRAR